MSKTTSNEMSRRNIVRILTKIQDEGDINANAIATQAIKDLGLDEDHKQLQSEYLSVRPIAELNVRFDALTGTGEEFVVDVPNIVKLKVRLMWKIEFHPSIDIIEYTINPELEQFLTRSNMRGVDYTALGNYVVNTRGDNIKSFQNRIDRFNKDAAAWGMYKFDDEHAYYKLSPEKRKELEMQ